MYHQNWRGLIGALHWDSSIHLSESDDSNGWRDVIYLTDNIYPQLSNNHKKKYSACFAVPSSCSMALWHQRLAHTSYRIVSKMANNEEVYELNLPNNKATPNHHCLVCLSGKMHRLPFPIRRTRANQIGQLIHADVCGPMHYPHQVEHATSYFSRTNSLDGAMFVS
jgi:hypothetical protein